MRPLPGIDPRSSPRSSGCFRRRLIARLHALFQACNHERYAPQAGGHDLETLRAEAEAAVRELRTIP